MTKRTALLVGTACTVLSISAVAGWHVPLYDGIGNPDEPYRYVQPPTAAKRTKLPAGSIITTVPAVNGSNSEAASGYSSEYGPQVVVYLTKGSLQTDAAATTITVSFVPLAPDLNRPMSGPVAGNIYRLSARSNQGIVQLGGALGYLDLRLPQGFPVGAAINFRATGSTTWKSLVTNQIGNDIYESSIVNFGDYGLVPAKVTPSHSWSAGRIAAFVSASAFFLVIVGTIFVIRRASHTQSNAHAK